MDVAFDGSDQDFAVFLGIGALFHIGLDFDRNIFEHFTGQDQLGDVVNTFLETFSDDFHGSPAVVENDDRVGARGQQFSGEASVCSSSISAMALINFSDIIFPVNLRAVCGRCM